MMSLAHLSRNRKAAFTIAELMIATAIVGVLSSVAVPAFKRYLEDARLTDGVMMLSHIRRDQQDVYMRTMAWGQPTYGRAFQSTDPNEPTLSSVNFSSRFAAIVGPAGLPAGVLGRSTQLPNSPLTDDFVGAENLALAWGSYRSDTNYDLYRAAVIGDVDGDSQRMIMFATPNVPILVWCDDLNNSQEFALDLNSVFGSVPDVRTQMELLGGGTVPALGAGVRCDIAAGIPPGGNP